MRILSKCVRVGYKYALKPVLFSFDPEKIHDLFLHIGNFLGKHSVLKKINRIAFYYENPILRQKICGIEFKNPVGLSEGFDKDGMLVNILDDVGFGFMQVGSVTLCPYEGNTKPRLKRLKNSKSIWVNFGLKNIGVEKILRRISKRKNKAFPISISVAKTNCWQTAEKSCGIKDYLGSLKHILETQEADFLTLNISCPNAFGGEPFTDKESLTELLSEVFKDFVGLNIPVFIKMPLSLEWKNFKELLDVILNFPISGVIVGNLMKDRAGVHPKDSLKHLHGGISGKPMNDKANEYIAKTYLYCGDRLKIIGVGGVFSAEDAYKMIKNGASLVQLITGMLFEGPQLIGEINEGLVKLLRKDGFNALSEAIGKNVKK
ncbi:MAG: quinone-dependent dihydroorotate dehydrogenase [Candidatus Gracilibacteria bacterium]|jgi:dihydroorotate dehydrogenase subfamily 2|nr:quinone-dependent dihydroorotate dehydrogenase [Candidatus Gracilibacteria bacterium]